MFQIYDNSRVTFHLGFFFMGCAFALFITRMVVSIVANTWYGTVTAVSLFETALWITIAAGICLVVGVGAFYKNSTDAKQTGKTPSTSAMHQYTLISFLATIGAAVLSIILPIFIG